MKKFMKAIAFATVMCLVLSTAAFAAVEVENYATKTVKVTVEGVQKGEQVAIIITKDGASFTEENVLFVDQKVAGTSTAEFTATIADAGETIDVYAGFASNALANAVPVAEDFSLVEPLEEIVVTLVGDVTVIDDVTAEADYDAEEMGEVDPGTKGSLVYCKLNVTGDTGEVTGMWWAFKVTKDATTDTKYVAGDETIVDAINGGVLVGDVEIAVAFNSTDYTVDDANVILSVNGDDVVLGEENADIAIDRE